MLVLQSLALPAFLVVITSFQLRKHLLVFVDFFQTSELADQACMLTLSFAVVFGVLSLALAILQDDMEERHSRHSAVASRDYLTQPNNNKRRILKPQPQSTVDNHNNDDDPLSSYPLSRVREALTQDDGETQAFGLLYQHVRDKLLEYLTHSNEMTPEAVDWCRQLVDYTVPNGKWNRGMTVWKTYCAIQQAAQQQQQPAAGKNPNAKRTTKLKLTTKELVRCAVGGWAIEFCQSYFITMDDVMDQCVERRGKPSWHRHVPQRFHDNHKSKRTTTTTPVGLMAINDAALLESFVFTILKQHFKANEPETYHALVDLMLDVVQKTELGQLLDLMTSPPSVNAMGGATAVPASPMTSNHVSSSNQINVPLDLHRFSLDHYSLIVKYKTAFYSFYLPIAAGMILSGKVAQPQAFRYTKRICTMLGQYFQVQNDYWDCFGQPEKRVSSESAASKGSPVSSGGGSNITDGACTWLVVQALARVQNDPHRRNILEQNYGHNHPAKEAKVKALYKELELDVVFESYKASSRQAIQNEIERVQELGVPKEVFEMLVRKVYRQR